MERNGPVTWTGTGTLTSGSGTINNASTWDCQSAATITASEFNNSGTVKKTAGRGRHAVQRRASTTRAPCWPSSARSPRRMGEPHRNFDVSAGCHPPVHRRPATWNAGTTFTGSGTFGFRSSAASTSRRHEPSRHPDLRPQRQRHLGGAGATGLTTEGTFRWSGGTIVRDRHLQRSARGGAGGAQEPQHPHDEPQRRRGGHGRGGGHNGAVINNAGTFDLQADVAFTTGAEPRPPSTTRGRSRSPEATGATMSVPVAGTGSLLVQSGTLSLQAGPQHGQRRGGRRGRRPADRGGWHDLERGSAFTGTGNLTVSSGSSSVPARSTSSAGLTFSMAGGFIAGSGTLTLGGHFNWSGGTLTSRAPSPATVP